MLHHSRVEDNGAKAQRLNGTTAQWLNGTLPEQVCLLQNRGNQNQLS